MTYPEYQVGAIDAGAAVSNAWNMLKANYGMYLGIAILTLLLTGCIPCLNVIIAGPVMGGVFLVALRDMRGEPVDFGMMFKGFEKFVPLMVIGLIQAIPGIIAQIVQYSARFAELGLQGSRGRSTSFYQASAPDFALSGGILALVLLLSLGFMVFAFFWWAVFFFAIPLVMEHDLSPIDAIKLSARAAMSNLGGMLVLMLFEVLVVLLGMLVLCVGVFLISMPVIFLANAFAYRQVFPWIERQMNMAPPDPGQYGFGSQPPQWS
jgi:uncharacterized membrane protein